MQTRWYDRQLAVGKSLVQQGSQALRQGDFNTATAAFAEARAVLDMAEEPTLEVKKLRAQLMNETGFIAQRGGNADRAVANHRAAAALCDEIIASGEEFRSNAAATNINLAGLLAGAGKLDEALQASEVAIGFANSLVSDGVEPEQTKNLLFGANLNHAMILAKRDRWDDAERAMGASMELVEGLAAKNKSMYAQGAQGCQQLSVLMFHNEKFERALVWGRRAEELSEKAYHVLGEQALGLYVTSQVNLVSFYERQDLFGDAESALFKALDVVGDHPQILLRAKAFYEQCRKLADNKLEAGNLPREEVDEGYDEILERIEAAGGVDELRAEIEAEEAADDDE